VSKACIAFFFLSFYHLPFLFSERDAIDVENAKDYGEMVANLASLEPDKIKILVDMKTIRSSCGRMVRRAQLTIPVMYLTLRSEMRAMMKTIHHLIIMKARYETSFFRVHDAYMNHRMSNHPAD
jgi:hypothetical protein